MTRMLQREFGTPPSRDLPHPHRPPPAFNSVALSTQLSDFFALQMKSPSRVRSGMLFGYSEDDVLYVLLASTAGPSNWYEAGTRTALNIDPHFALGWSEALLGLFGARIDWIGNWVVHPNSQLKSNERDVRRFRDGFRSGLIDDRSILLVAGYMDGVLQTRTYTGVFEEGPTLVTTVHTKVTALGQIWKPQQ